MFFHPGQEWYGYQLKKKFTKLANTKMGTGNPTTPDDVHEAKEIQCLIIATWNMVMEIDMERIMKTKQ